MSYEWYIILKSFRQNITEYVETRQKTTEPTTCEFELHRLSALRLSVWLFDNRHIHFFYID